MVKPISFTPGLNPIALIRGRSAAAPEAFGIGQCINDRPYAASALLVVAMRRGFATALAGRSRERPALAETAIHLECDCRLCLGIWR